MKALLSAVQFLTIVPLRIRGEVTPEDMGRSTGYYPLAGILQGVVTAGVIVLLARVFPAAVVATLFVLISTLANGGFHLDGLSDTLDALAVRAQGETADVRTRRLAVMKTGTAGPIGVTGISFSLLIKVLCSSSIIGFSTQEPGLMMSCLASVPVAGKWAMVTPLVFGRPARTEGLGSVVMTNSGIREFVTALVTIFIYTLVAALVFVPSPMKTGFMGVLFVMIPALYLLSVLVRKLATSAFGGLTGDVFGFTNEMGEILYLLVAAGWLQHST